MSREHRHAEHPSADEGVISSHWFKLAVVHTAAGTLLGLVTAALIVFLSQKIFPGLADFDYDMGLRIERFADEHLKFFGTGMVPKPRTDERAGLDAYLFVDVDPQLEGLRNEAPAGKGACAALQAKHADRFVLAQPVDSKAGAVRSPGKTVLECGSARPVNRYLLAEVVSELRRRGAGLIVLDVELGDADSELPAAERTALEEVLRMPRGQELPVLFVQPASPLNQKNWWCRRLGLSYFHFSGLGSLLCWRM